MAVREFNRWNERCGRFDMVSTPRPGPMPGNVSQGQYR
jgi:hypothetical protein